MNKKIYWILSLTLMMIVAACIDEDKKPFDDFQKGSIPLFVQKEDDSGFINLNDLDASNLSFSVDKEGLADVESIDVIVTYNNSVTGESEEVTYTTITSFPTDVAITTDELVDAFAPETVTKDSISLGDSFVVTGYVKLTDGRYLSGGFSPSVVTTKPVILTYNVACPSDLAGTYDLELVFGESGEVQSLPGQTITRIAAGYYEISDMTMDIFGPDFPIKYRFTDICQNLTPDGESVDFGTAVVIQFNSGTNIDPVTGVITFDIEYIAPSCCGLEGIKTTFTATPQ